MLCKDIPRAYGVFLYRTLTATVYLNIPRAYGGVSETHGCCVMSFVGFYLNLKEKGRMI